MKVCTRNGGKKSLTTTPSSTISSITMPADEVIDEDEELVLQLVPNLENESSVIPVPFIDTVEYVDKYPACMNCNKKKLLQIDENKTVKSGTCGHTMRLDRCVYQTLVKFLVKSGDDCEILNLTVFQNVLSKVIADICMMSCDELIDRVLSLEDITI